MSRYNAFLKQEYNNDDAIVASVSFSGKPIVFNAVAVALGFLVLIISSFWPVANIGWLVAVNMILSAFFSLLIIPAVLGLSKSKKETGEKNENS
jgi:predicted RND superfamily exporter protein